MLFGNINYHTNYTTEHKSAQGKEIPQIKSNKIAKSKGRSLIPEDILQSPLNKLLSSPFMGNINSNMNMNSMQVTNNPGSKSKHSSGSPMGSIGMSSGGGGSVNSKHQLQNGIKTMAVKHSPTFYGHDINYDNTLRQSGSSGGNRNPNFMHHQIRATINSKKVINFDDNKDDHQENNTNQVTSHGNDQSTRKSGSNTMGQNQALGLRERDSNCGNSPGIKERNGNFFGNDGAYNSKQESDEFYSKKFAMMIPTTKQTSQMNGQGQVGANKSNENPPTYKRW